VNSKCVEPDRKGRRDAARVDGSALLPSLSTPRRPEPGDFDSRVSKESVQTSLRQAGGVSFVTTVASAFASSSSRTSVLRP